MVTVWKIQVCHISNWDNHKHESNKQTWSVVTHVPIRGCPKARKPFIVACIYCHFLLFFALPLSIQKCLQICWHAYQNSLYVTMHQFLLLCNHIVGWLVGMDKRLLTFDPVKCVILTVKAYCFEFFPWFKVLICLPIVFQTCHEFDLFWINEYLIFNSSILYKLFCLIFFYEG